MPNGWSKQSYVQGFYCETIYFKNDVNMFERMEIDESIYDGVVKSSYLKNAWAESNRTGLFRNNIK